jgi:DNA primase catalytic subunit
LFVFFRIQQIQILLAANTSHEHKQKVWSQIEASMHLQRSKTIANMCFSKQRVKDSARKDSSTQVQTSTTTETGESAANADSSVSNDITTMSNGTVQTKATAANGSRAGGGRFKQVRL